MIDDTKLAAMPLMVSHHTPTGREYFALWSQAGFINPTIAEFNERADAEFHRLVRNVVDIMDRRSWYVVSNNGPCWITGLGVGKLPDRFRAYVPGVIRAWELMVEADKWMRENEG